MSKDNHREHFVKSEEGKAKGEKSSIPSLSSLFFFHLSSSLISLPLSPLPAPLDVYYLTG